ncbi:S8 family serine peptidase [Rubrivirga sp.]|uniref:S8 family serine peptidase n=1 Tax=Rubrivirga sp. TaxID=1885344 RepID=UPI003C712106
MALSAPPVEVEAAFQALEAKARRDGVVRLIVGLDVDFVPEGQQSRRRASSQRATIEQRQASLLARLSDAAEVRRFRFTPAIVLEATPADVDALRRAPEVVSILEDVPVPVYAEVETGANAPSRLDDSTILVGATAAWAQGFTGEGYEVAVLDTGTDETHPFLAGQVSSGACFSTSASSGSFTSETLCPSGQRGEVGPTAGTNCDTGEWGSGCDHGTHVAGIAAGGSVGGATTPRAGVAPGADIVAVQVFSGFTAGCVNDNNPCVLAFGSDQIAGLEHVYDLVVNEGRNIVSANMSLGGGQYFGTCDTNGLKSIIDNLLSVGVATVIASGNDGYQNSTGSPGCISTAVTVGSSTKADGVSGFSNVAPWMDLFAPGSSIRSSVTGGRYSNFNGTSMATPHVAGAFAVMRQRFPLESVQQTVARLQESGVAITAGTPAAHYYRIQIDDAFLDAPEIALEVEPLRALLAPGETVTETVTITNVAGAESRPLRLGLQEASTSYEWRDSSIPAGPVADFVDISGTGTALGLGDDEGVALTLPFGFPFYGTSQASTIVSSNGYLAFGGSGRSAGNTGLPSSGGPRGTIAPFWDDLDPSSRGEVYVQDMGDGRWVVQWDDVPRYNDLATSLTFQAVLSDDGTISFQYATMSGMLSAATVGIESPNEDDGVTVVANAPYVSSSTAIQFGPPVAAFAATLGRTTLSHGESTSLAVTFDATGLEAGTYETDLTVTSNDLDEADVVIPLVLEVGVAGAIAGNAGWRLIGPPSDVSVADLAALNLVQGVPGQFPDAVANVLTYTSGVGWAPPTSSAAVLPRGRGLGWFFFDDDLEPDPSSAGGGSGESFSLPMSLVVTGGATADVDVDLPDTPDEGGQRWALLANPFDRPLRLANLADKAVWPGADGLASSEAQVYDPSGPTYVLGSDIGEIEPWQAFWVLNGSSTSLTIPAAEAGGQARTRQDDRPRIAFSLHGMTRDGLALEDRAASIVFDTNSSPGADRRDAPKLVPPADAYVLIGARVEGGTGPALQSLAAVPEGTSVDLAVQTVGASDSLTVRWPRLDVPPSWALTLLDRETGLEVDLRTAEAYSFTAPSGPARLRRMAGESSAPAVSSVPDARFVLSVSAFATDADTDLEAEWSLSVGPNPSSGAVRIQYGVPIAGPVRLAVYDVLGREVAVLEDGDRSVGDHRASLPAGRLAPGVYVARLSAEGHALSRPVTIVR